jgi:Holliday junction DNA helicase RuvA
MIGKLRGKIDHIGDDHILLDVNGVGYVVHASQKLLAKAAYGEAMAVLVDTHVREDAITLYGFADSSEQQWFRLLTQVQGVGARVGLAILSTLSAQDLLLAIGSGDARMLQRVSGVGPKLALRIVTELKDKAALVKTTAEPFVAPAHAGSKAEKKEAAPTAAPDINEDAIAALASLGYGRAEAFQAVARVLKAQPEIASLQQLIPAALKELSNQHA